MPEVEHSRQATAARPRETMSTSEVRTFLREWRAWRTVAETREKEHDEQILHLMDDAAEQAQAAAPR